MAGQIKWHRGPFKSMELFATFRGAGGPELARGPWVCGLTDDSISHVTIETASGCSCRKQNSTLSRASVCWGLVVTLHWNLAFILWKMSDWKDVLLYIWWKTGSCWKTWKVSFSVTLYVDSSPTDFTDGLLKFKFSLFFLFTEHHIKQTQQLTLTVVNRHSMDSVFVIWASEDSL